MRDLLTVTHTREHTDRCRIDILRPVGEIEHDAWPALERALGRLDRPTGRVHLDMAGVVFMDSAGAHFLARLERLVRRDGGLLRVTGLGRQPAMVVGLARALSPRPPS